MKKMLLAAIMLTATTVFAAMNLWKNDKAHSQLTFTVAHLGINDVMGTINDFDVTIATSKEDFSDAVITLDAKVASIDTRIEARDKHLRSPDFFDAEKYPSITFKSTKLKKVKKNKYLLDGELTMHGVTKPVQLHWIFKGETANPRSKARTVAFQLSGTIKRSDFGVGANFPATMVSDEVRILADGEFVQ